MARCATTKGPSPCLSRWLASDHPPTKFEPGISHGSGGNRVDSDAVQHHIDFRSPGCHCACSDDNDGPVEVGYGRHFTGTADHLDAERWSAHWFIAPPPRSSTSSTWSWSSLKHGLRVSTCSDKRRLLEQFDGNSLKLLATPDPKTFQSATKQPVCLQSCPLIYTISAAVGPRVN